MAFTPDGLPIVSPVPDPDLAERVWLCCPCNGHGMSLGYRLAGHAAAGLLGEEPPLFPLARFTKPS
jgi:glycine/D-amino acid oxidase-like deaminating enzyme